MKKMVNISYEDYINYSKTIKRLEEEVEKLNDELNFIKDNGEEILVIVKEPDKPDNYEYKTTDKQLLFKLVDENTKLREKLLEVYDKYNKELTYKYISIIKYNKLLNKIEKNKKKRWRK